jgi:hypothetical protein
MGAQASVCCINRDEYDVFYDADDEVGVSPLDAMWRISTTQIRKRASATDRRELDLGAPGNGAWAEQCAADFRAKGAEWVTAKDAMRLLDAADGNQDLARKKLEKAAAWKQSTLDPWRREVKDPKWSEPRVISEDEQGRPVIYSCAVHQVRGDHVPSAVALAIENAIHMSGVPETQVSVLLDCRGFQPLLNLDLRPIMNLAPSFDSYFAERLHRVYVIDQQPVGQHIGKMVLSLLPPRTRAKVHFVQSDEISRYYDDLGLDAPTFSMLKELLRMNGLANTATGRGESVTFTRDFLLGSGRQRYVEPEIRPASSSDSKVRSKVVSPAEGPGRLPLLKRAFEARALVATAA